MRILVVDDARLLGELTGTPLGRSGLIIQAVGLGDDIADLAEATQPAVILLEESEVCPQALDACRRIRIHPATRHIPIVFVGSGLNLHRCRDAGVSAFLARPITRLELREAIARLLPLADRVALRRRLRTPVEFVAGDRVFCGFTHDVSLSGAFLELDGDLLPRTRGTLRCTAEGRALALDAEVVRQGPATNPARSVAVRFVDLDAETQAFLSRFVRRAGERRAGAAVELETSSGGPA